MNNELCERIKDSLIRQADSMLNLVLKEESKKVIEVGLFDANDSIKHIEKEKEDGSKC